MESLIHQQGQQKRVDSFSLALKQRDQEQLIHIANETYDFQTLLMMAESMFEAMEGMNIVEEQQLLVRTWYQLHEAMADTLFFLFGGYTVDGPAKVILDKALNALSILPSHIRNETLDSLKRLIYLGPLKTPETKRFVDALVLSDFDSAKTLINECELDEVVEDMGKNALRLAKLPNCQDQGFRGAELAQDRLTALMALKAEAIYQRYGGNYPDG